MIAPVSYQRDIREIREMIGQERALDDTLSLFEKYYIRVFGVPINGLRIRARRILPLVTSKYKKIMDAGCGQGIFSFEIARRLPDSSITGVDIDKELIDRNRRIAEKLGLRNCVFEIQDIERIEKTDSYDLILSVDNLEHLKEDDRALESFYAALKPAGELILHVPAYYRRWFFFNWKVNFDVEGHFRPGYTKDEIEEKTQRAGFAIFESYYTFGFLENLTNNISYLITGARMKNKLLYGLILPLLLFIAYFGRNSRPARGAGVLIKARKGK
jgi:2-polyprenyl-3-methyl-5-hydroxy-6-metoxy-1,4-benzoquinol methylase